MKEPQAVAAALGYAYRKGRITARRAGCSVL